MTLPTLKVTINNEIYGLPHEGELKYSYSPLYNLQNINAAKDNLPLKGLNIPSDKAGIDIHNPLNLETEVCYDDSINIIINDHLNPPKIVNSRFYLTSSSKYKIADRKGNLDTNIYSEDNFKLESSLIKTTRTIATLDFLGIEEGGKMPVGNYTFYFKLADADGNESDFISESSKVVCHIGGINKPNAIRGGQLNEDSNKIIKFRLNNLDLSYDYINVYYTKASGDGESEILQTFKINSKFKITNDSTEFSISGYEDHEEISIDDINIQYESFKSVQSVENCQNISFAGSTTNDYELFSELEKLSLLITPEIVYDEEGIGNLDHQYQEQNFSNGWEYYNVKNIYYKLGYWDEEIYRFGIVYILNDYTLSPVFNIRGKKEIDKGTEFDKFTINDIINYGDDYIIQKKNKELTDENIKGVFKINTSDINSNNSRIFNKEKSIKPIGIKFNVAEDAIKGGAVRGLSDLTKGCFMVRQKRIPTILAQGIGMGTSKLTGIPLIKAFARTSENKSKESWISQSFLKRKGSASVLESEIFQINDNLVIKNALFSPEVSLRSRLFNTFFNSSEFKLRPAKYNCKVKVFSSFDENPEKYILGDMVRDDNTSEDINAELTLIEPGIERLSNGKYLFSSKAGDELIAYKHVDPILGAFENPEYAVDDNGDPTYTDINNFNDTTSKVRGEFNTFIGCNKENIINGQHYNIFQQGYDFEKKWKDYFILRYNDSSPFYPVTDRVEWKNYNPKEGIIGFRGDCYINTYTQRINWNFIDPELPTNHTIIDPYTWTKNFRISVKNDVDIKVSNNSKDNENKTYRYKKLLQLFTHTKNYNKLFSGDEPDIDFDDKILEPTDKKYKRYSEANGVFGAEKINRPDVNAVPLGHWVTVKVCSNINLALRDIDMSRPAEEAIHNKKRGFYPLNSIDKLDNLPESSVINSGISKSQNNKHYFEIPDVPFLKNSFSTRIHYSYPLIQSSFINGNRIFEKKNYQDYTLEHGALIKLVEWYGTLIAVMEHGILMIPVNERAMMTNESGQNVYINTKTVLPQNPKVLSNMFGSLWADSIIKTSKFIYGIDTVGKKIWRTNGETFEIISDLKIQKFLNDNITLKEVDRDKTVGKNFIKTHYNAFKQDVLFTFVYDKEAWNLCWNEASGKWVTRYTWFPEFSENINNIFYTFAHKRKHSEAGNKLYKHGFAGYSDIGDEILPTKWYDEQHPFEFEFVVNNPPGIQKIYNNLKIVSNNVAPDSFIYEIVGDGYNWSKDKILISDINEKELDISDNQGIGFGYPFPWLL